MKLPARQVVGLLRFVSVVGLLCLTVIPFSGLQAQEEPKGGGEEAQIVERIKKQRAIFTMLTAYALDNRDAYPNEPADANQNFRLLFFRKLIDDERIFSVAGDPWIAPGKPDRDIGAGPAFLKAGEAGEVCITYIAGLRREARPDLPIMLSGADPEATRWITGQSKKAPAKPFTGKVVVTLISGTTMALNPDPDGKIRLPLNGTPTDLFSEAYGTDPSAVRLPKEVKKAGKD